jgi:hypothetical protein
VNTYGPRLMLSRTGAVRGGAGAVYLECDWDDAMRGRGSSGGLKRDDEPSRTPLTLEQTAQAAWDKARELSDLTERTHRADAT